MKRSIAALILSLTAIFCAHGEWRYGLRIGGSGSVPHLSDNNGWTASRCSGFSGGVTFEWQHSCSGLAVDMSALYSRAGATLRSPQGEKFTAARNFVEVPVNLKYKFWLKSIKELAGPYVYTGPTLMMRVDGDSKGAPFSSSRLQPGWNLGVGLDVINFLQIQGGYRFGLGNTADVPGGFKMRADGWNVSVAFLFDF